MKHNIAVIDLFAGPGGLGEGFSKAGFQVILSIEKDPVACETLKLRHFYHQFTKSVPNIYYDVIKGYKNTIVIKKQFPKYWRIAEERVLQAEIGKDTNIINERINQAIKKIGKGKLIIIGGPPCQAYSIAGRSKRLGIGDKNNKQIKKIFKFTEKDFKIIDTKEIIQLIKNKINELNNSLSNKNILKSILNDIENKQNEFYLDSRHKLYEEYLNIIKKYKPDLFVMENVKGINSATIPNLSGKKDKIIDKILTDIQSCDYKAIPITKVQTNLLQDKNFLIKSENYSIPQNRHRVIIIGTKNNNQNILQTIPAQETLVTVKDMINDMPIIRSGLSKSEDNYNLWLNVITEQIQIFELDELREINQQIKNYPKLERGELFIKNDYYDLCNNTKKWMYDENLNGVIQHTTRSHMKSDLIRYIYLSLYAKKNKGQAKISDWPVILKPNHKNIIIDNKKLDSKVHIDRFKVQEWNKPSSTITSHISKDGHYYIHPDPLQARSLTPREAARLQTFPENYFFYGGRTAQYHQIGNAVPPYLAFQIAKSIKKYFK